MSSERPKRRDAQENRDRLLDAAELVFAASGLDTPVHRIADEAGVGIGTFYRHFPSSSALVLAVFERLSQRVNPKLSTIAEMDDPRAALIAYFDAIIAFFEDYPHAPAVFLRVRDMAEEPRPVYGLTVLLDPLVERGRAAGAYRDDLTAIDLALLPLIFAPYISYERSLREIYLPRVRTLALDAILVGGTGERLPALPASQA